MTLEQFLGLLSGVRREGKGWKALCPAHPDRNPSLSVNRGRNGGIVVNCFSHNCPAEAIAAAVGVPLAELQANSASRKKRNVAPAPPEPKAPLAITEAEVARMETALGNSAEAQAYLTTRGISLQVAQRLRFGFAEQKYFRDANCELPAIAMPDFRDGKLVGVKYRSIAGRYHTYATGSVQEGLVGRDALDPNAPEVYVFEGPMDWALALSYDRNAVALQSATSKCGGKDLAALKHYAKVYLVGDMDEAGQIAMEKLGAALPPEKVSRVRLRGVKDVGELWEQNPAMFNANLSVALRIADIRRVFFGWEDLETETELKAGGTGVLPHLVADLLPLDDMTMFAGREGSGKTLLALYIGKCVANGAPVFGCLNTVKKPVLYLDAENQPSTHQVYLPFFGEIGPEEIRFRTRRYGVPPLADPALMRIVEEKRPLLIVDSLVRFCEARDRDNTEMTVVMEQLARLVTAGATVLLIHHTKKSDEEEYANSFVIGATVAFWYAIVADDKLGVKRVKMLHKKARGGSEITRNLIAFPHILDLGMFTLDGDPPKTDREKLIEFLRERGGANFTTIKKEVKGMSTATKAAILKEAVEAGDVVKGQDGRADWYSV